LTETEKAGPGPRRPFLWLALAVFWLLVLGTHTGFGLPLLDAIVVGVLLGVMPVFALGQARVLHEIPFQRLAAYWSSIATLWVLGATAWLVGTREAGASAVGLVWLGPGPTFGWTAALTAGGLALMIAFRWIAALAGVRESRMLRRLLPRSRQERRVFVLLSVAAGSGEEIAYRGYAIPVVATVTGVVPSVVLTSILFGVLHAYQGVIGIARTALVGALLAVGFLASGSLVPSMLAHLAIDLVAGLLLAEWLVEDEETSVPSAG